MEIQPNYQLSDLTTFHIGGPALFFVEIGSNEELKQALEFAREKKITVQVLGRGSNVLISDEGFSGLVIRNQIKKLDFDNGLVTIGAGENWDDVVVAAIEKNLAGIECLSGVPGSAGGAVVQNIGAYGQTIGDLITEVRAIEVATGQEKVFSSAECEFKYRSSWFKQNPNKYVVTSFTVKLQPNGEPTISYLPVQKYFENKSKPTLADLRQFIIKVRAAKGYLIMPGYESYNTAGSFFKNPIVTNEQYERLKQILGDPKLNRFWPTPNGVKIAAAFLMQEAGFAKGYQNGNVGISPKHSLSLVNLGGAKATEVRALAEQIKSAVQEKFGVQLEEEVLFV